MITGVEHHVVYTVLPLNTRIRRAVLHSWPDHKNLRPSPLISNMKFIKIQSFRKIFSFLLTMDTLVVYLFFLIIALCTCLVRSYLYLFSQVK